MSGCMVTRWPLSEWTAYWTNPPTWPRTLVCESSLSANNKNSKKPWIVLALIVFTYFFTMDFVLFTHFLKSDMSQSQSGISKDEMYKPWTRLSVKAMLNDHMSQFLIAPSTEYLDMVTKFSHTFSFITPNMISAFHGVVGFVAGNFLSSSELADRRLGVVLFEWRTWLDAFDGTVHRAQQGLRLRYNSDHSTLGYAVDSIADTLGGCFLSFSIFFYMVKKYHTNTGTGGKDQTALLPTTTGQVAPPGKGCLFLKTLSYGICLGVAGKCWGQTVEDFSLMFQTPIEKKELHELQLQMSHSGMTLVLFYLWRLFGSQAVLNYTLIAVFTDQTEIKIHQNLPVFPFTSCYNSLHSHCYLHLTHS